MQGWEAFALSKQETKVDAKTIRLIREACYFCSPERDTLPDPLDAEAWD